LVLALALAIVGQLTTTLMYFANAMSLARTCCAASDIALAKYMSVDVAGGAARARQRGPLRFRGDDLRHVRRPVGFGRGRARARLRLAPRQPGGRRQGVPDRQPRLLDREDPAVGGGRHRPPPAPGPDAAADRARGARPRAARGGSRAARPAARRRLICTP